MKLARASSCPYAPFMTSPRLKTATERSLFGGVLILLGDAIATAAVAWGTPDFWPIVLVQLGGVLAGVGLLVERQRRAPSAKLSKGDVELLRADEPERR